MPFTLRNLREDLADVGSNFDGAPDLEFRVASKALELEQSGLSYQRIPPDYRFPYGHTHKEQEEVFAVVGGSGRMSSTTRSSRSSSGTSCASHPVRGEGTRPGRRASRSSSSARPTSARTRGPTWRVSETGGSTERRSVDGQRVPSRYRRTRLTPSAWPWSLGRRRGLEPRSGGEGLGDCRQGR